MSNAVGKARSGKDYYYTKVASISEEATEMLTHLSRKNNRERMASGGAEVQSIQTPEHSDNLWREQGIGLPSDNEE